MRSFLIKVFIYLLVIFTVIASVVSFYYESSKFPFFSNSLSFNAKAKFIIDNQKSYKEANYFVIGSSMSLNNIDCNLLTDTIGKQVFNLSSWGMGFNQFDGFKIWDTTNVVITNIHFQDFHHSLMKKKYGYPYSNFGLISYLNISIDFGTYRKHLIKYKISIHNDINDHYDDLWFNKSGSLIFCNKEMFNLSEDRWNEVIKMPIESELSEFINSVRAKSKKVKKLIILFSPGRPSITNLQKVNFVNELMSSLNSVPNVVFFNNFNVSVFSDEDFVDHSHFSGQGAKKYSEIVASQIKSLELK